VHPKNTVGFFIAIVLSVALANLIICAPALIGCMYFLGGFKFIIFFGVSVIFGWLSYSVLEHIEFTDFRKAAGMSVITTTILCPVSFAGFALSNMAPVLTERNNMVGGVSSLFSQISLPYVFVYLVFLLVGFNLVSLIKMQKSKEIHVPYLIGLILCIISIFAMYFLASMIFSTAFP